MSPIRADPGQKFFMACREPMPLECPPKLAPSVSQPRTRAPRVLLLVAGQTQTCVVVVWIRGVKHVARRSRLWTEQCSPTRRLVRNSDWRRHGPAAAGEQDRHQTTLLPTMT